MAINFNPPVDPQAGTSKTREWPTLEARSQDGYSQRAPLGANHDREMARLEWPTLSHSEANTIETVLASAFGVVVINYAVPPSATSKQWICRRIERSEPDALNSAISAEFEEVFDP